MLPFFVRRYNDIDHITPIVYRMAKDGFRDMAVLCLDLNYNLASDLRLKFLREEMKVPVAYAHQFLLPTRKHRAAMWLALGLRPATAGGQNLIDRLKNGPFRMICDSPAWSRLFDRGWAAEFIAKFQPGVLIFDWQKPRMPVVKALFAASKALRIPLLGVPHGGHLTVDKCWTDESAATGQPPPFGENWQDFDRVIIQDSHFAELVIDCGVERGKVKVIGSARYCAEWSEIVHRLYKDTPEPVGRGGGRLKVLYLDHDATYRIHPERVAQAIKRMNSLDMVDLIVKPSTGGACRFISDESSGMSSAGLRAMAKMATNCPTPVLVKWADVVMGTTTSALLEAPVQGKTVVMPTYLHANSTLFEKLGACWPVSSDEELAQALASIHHNPAGLPYSKADTDRFLAELVYGGEPGRDVLGMYKDFILAVRDERA